MTRVAGYRFCAKALSLSCFVSLWLHRELIWAALERTTEGFRVAGTSQCHLVTHPHTAQPTSKPNATSKADQVAQGHTWLRLECLQGWRLHNSRSLKLWSTHCSLDAVGHLNTSHHAAIQQWAGRSLCAGQHSASPWSFRGFAFLLVPYEKKFPSVLEWLVRTMWIAGTFIFAPLGFRKYFLPLCLSVYPILIFFLPREKKKKEPSKFQ